MTKRTRVRFNDIDPESYGDLLAIAKNVKLCLPFFLISFGLLMASLTTLLCLRLVSMNRNVQRSHLPLAKYYNDNQEVQQRPVNVKSKSSFYDANRHQPFVPPNESINMKRINVSFFSDSQLSELSAQKMDLDSIAGAVIFRRNNLSSLSPSAADHSGARPEQCPKVKGRRILINYAADAFSAAQQRNCASGLSRGGFDVCIALSRNSLDESFRKRNNKLLHVKRGAGYFIWKPYIVLKVLLAMDENDLLFYSDSAIEFIANVDRKLLCQPWVDFDRQEIILFALSRLEAQYTKADALILLDCDAPRFTETTQRSASFVLFKKTPTTIQFVAEWLTYVQDERIIDDEKSRLRQESLFFVNHRHEQSVLSLLSKKYSIPASSIHPLLTPDSADITEGDSIGDNNRNSTNSFFIIQHSRRGKPQLH